MQEHFPNFLRLGSYTVNRVFRAMKMPKLAQDIINTYWGYLGVDMPTISPFSSTSTCSGCTSTTARGYPTRPATS